MEVGEASKEKGLGTRVAYESQRSREHRFRVATERGVALPVFAMHATY